MSVDFRLFFCQLLLVGSDSARAVVELLVARIKIQMYLMKFSKAAGG
jgi:hypothetical protein